MYAYDSFGRRVSKIEDGVQERYVYDGNNLIATLNNASGLIKANTFGPGIDQPIGSSANSANQFYYANHQGSIMTLADTSSIVSQYKYEPFGATSVNGDSVNQLRYTSREQDHEDIYFYRFRYYDPTINIFVNEDPIGIRGGINKYKYVNNDPVNEIDPLGLARFCYRPLEKTRVVIGVPGSPADKDNLIIGHEHIWYDDKKENIGFGNYPTGTFTEDPSKLSSYKNCSDNYEDDLIREAVDKTEKGAYDLFSNNCQDWADRVRNQYWKLWQDKYNACSLKE